IIHSFIIFFPCFTDHRDLHSFPTRRSSDLGWPNHGCRWSCGRGAVAAAPYFVSKVATTSAIVPSGATHPPLMSGKSSLQLSHFLDRKSTRLNSSHVSISYAVFCLKKKNIP